MMITDTSAPRQASFIPDEVKSRILCFGDSLTHGENPITGGPRLSSRWPRALQECLGPGYVVIEEGQGGRTIATDDPTEGEKNGIRYILPCLESHSPLDLVIIMLGVNDCKHKFGYSLQDISWEMEAFLQKVLCHRHFQSADSYDVLLVAPPPLNDGLLTSWLGELFGFEEGLRKSRELAKWYRPLAEKYGIGFLDAGLYCRSNEADGVHMDAENQQKLAEAIADYIRRGESEK